jgi:hypothetical protein
MRALAVAAALTLTALALAAVPAAAAPGPCEGKQVGGSGLGVTYGSGCVGATVDPWDCLWREERRTVGAGPASATFTYCTGPDPDQPL